MSNGPLKFGNLHAFEWDMGHWPFLRARNHFWLGLTLQKFSCVLEQLSFTQVFGLKMQKSTFFKKKKKWGLSVVLWWLQTDLPDLKNTKN